MTVRNQKHVGLVACLIGCFTVGAIGIAAAGDQRNGDDRDARRAKMLKQADTNRDGKLEDAERKGLRAAKDAEHAAREQQLLKKYDANRNGRIDDAEHAVIANDRAAERFQQLDVNRDGKLTLAEFQAGKPPHDGRRHGPGRFGGGSHGAGRGMDRERPR